VNSYTASVINRRKILI